MRSRAATGRNLSSFAARGCILGRVLWLFDVLFDSHRGKGTVIGSDEKSVYLAVEDAIRSAKILVTGDFAPMIIAGVFAIDIDDNQLVDAIVLNGA